jgi:hypothetical protein
MRLDFSGVPGCSDPEPFVLALTPRVHGWDPLSPEGRWRLALTLARRPGGFEGTAQLYDPEGAVFWAKTVPAKTSCFIALDRLAFLTAFRIDPPGDPPPAAPPPKPPEPTMPVEPPKSPEPTMPPEPPPAGPEPTKPPDLPTAPVPGRFVPRVGVGGRAEFGGAWGVIFGVTVEGGVQRQEWRWGGWSLMGTLRWAPQQNGIGPPTGDPDSDVGISLVAGDLTGCIHRAWPVSLAGCVVGELGEVQQSAGTPTLPRVHQTALFVGAGARARIEARISDRLYVQVAADVRGVARLVGSTNHWVNVNARRLDGAAAGLGAGLGASF